MNGNHFLKFTEKDLTRVYKVIVGGNMYHIAYNLGWGTEPPGRNP